MRPGEPQLCIVSHRIIEEGLPVSLMLREAPQREGDSGWRFLSGREGELPKGGEPRLSFVEVASVLEGEPEIRALLDSPVGSAFSREGGAGPWKQVQGADLKSDANDDG